MTDDTLLGRLADEFTQRTREGKLPDIEQYALRHPGLAGRIRELFSTRKEHSGSSTSDWPGRSKIRQ